MHVHNSSSINPTRSSSKRGGKGLSDKLPEIHIPTYSYCGPFTKLNKRLARGDPGINDLDRACKEHDIAYSQKGDLAHRHKADYKLEQDAWKRFKSKDAGVGEKAAAWLVTTAMKAKRKLGMGLKTKTMTRRKKKHQRSGASPKKGKGVQQQRSSRRHKKKKRIIPIPRRSRGGFLPLLLPILGALGALGGGAAGIAKAVNDAKVGKQQLEEQQRHNLALEKAAATTTGKGKGLYLAPYKKNSQ